MATVKLTASAYTGSNALYVTVSNPANMYDDASDTSDYASLRGRGGRSSNSTYYCYIHGFDFSQVPNDAIVNSFTVRIRCYRNQYQSTGSSYRMRLCGSATNSAITGTTTSTEISTTAQVITIPTGSLTWAQLSGYGSGFSIQVRLRNTSTSSSNYPYVYVYGAEIEVDYTVPGPDIYSNYYIMTSYGGWSPCIEGNNVHGLRPFSGSVLPNCSGMATGRYNELLNLGACTWLGSWNGGDFLVNALAQGLPAGTDPVVGGAMVWRNSGEGHVAIVEQIISPTEIVCSESGWDWTSNAWEYRTHYYNHGRWHSNNAYRYQGCVYPPGTPPGPLPIDEGVLAAIFANIIWRDEE